MITFSAKWDLSSLKASKPVSAAVREAGLRRWLYLFCKQHPACRTHCTENSFRKFEIYFYLISDMGWGLFSLLVTYN